MPLTSRNDFLRDLGYEEPFDESPIDIPDGWYGGSVVNTGGNVMCRIWQTWETGQRAGEMEYEVIYNVSQDASVALQANTWDEGLEGYMFEHMIESRNAAENDDHSQAEVAKQLMEKHNKSE